MKRHTISPSQIELLRDHLRASRITTKVYFEVMDDESRFADYVAEIESRNESLFGYTLGGHGIGLNTRHPVSLDSTIERVLEDNDRFNNGGSFTFETP